MRFVKASIMKITYKILLKKYVMCAFELLKLGKKYLYKQLLICKLFNICIKYMRENMKSWREKEREE